MIEDKPIVELHEDSPPSFDELMKQFTDAGVSYAIASARPRTNHNVSRPPTTRVFVARKHRCAARALLLSANAKTLIGEPTLSTKDRERFLIFDTKSSQLGEIHLESRIRIPLGRSELLSIPAEVILECTKELDSDPCRAVPTLFAWSDTIAWAIGAAPRARSTPNRDDVERIDANTEAINRVVGFPPSLFDECVIARRKSAKGGPSVELQTRAREALENRRTSPPTPAITIECSAGWDASRTWLRWDGIEDRGLAAGGVSIAILGGDGAGKSTAVEAIRSLLATRIPVRVFHFGRPPSGFSSRIVYRAMGVLRRLGFSIPTPMTFDPAMGDQLSGLKRFGLMLHFICLCRDRVRIYRELNAWTHRGGVGVCDRYPDSRFAGMDGPRQQDLFPGSSGIMARLVRWESRQYHKIRPTNMEIILRVSPETAAIRQPEDDPISLRRRCMSVLEVIETLDGPEIIVDADADVADVHRELFRHLWAAL
jgi:hypothetical protein